MNIILLSGGSGKRLWPLSNDIRSKQFIKIFKKEDGTYESMVQRVYRQIKKVDTDATVTIATSKTQVSAIHNQLGEDVGISVEPCRRDTFPAIALATAYLVDVMHVDPSESVVVCPVDPYVEDNYFEALKELSEQADKREANLVLMGIEPTYPSEKYGYIRQFKKRNGGIIRPHITAKKAICTDTKLLKSLNYRARACLSLKRVLSTPFFTHLKKKICLKATGRNLTAESVNTTTSPAKAQNALKKSRRNGKYIQNQSKKFSAFQVCKTYHRQTVFR